jgi:ADP-ribose pyrophosphatase
MPPRTVGTRVVYRNRWTTLREDAIVNHDGTHGVYGVVEKPDFAIIIPLADGYVHLVEQYRYPVGGRFWELPQGALDGDHAADPLTVARTELAEETGLSAATWRKLGMLHPCYGLTTHTMHVFLASDLTPGAPRREATEVDMITARFPVAQFERMIRDGTIRDALSIAAYGLLKLGA